MADVTATSAYCRAVIDTNVLYSHRRRVTLVGLARLGRFEAIWSSWIVAELNRVRTWRWAEQFGTGVVAQQRASASAKEMMTYLLAAFTLVDPPFPHPVLWPELTDAWDIPTYSTAVEARAEYVITDDIRHSPPRDPATNRRVWEGIEYLTYHDFIALFTSQKLRTRKAPSLGIRAGG